MKDLTPFGYFAWLRQLHLSTVSYIYIYIKHLNVYTSLFSFLPLSFFFGLSLQHKLYKVQLPGKLVQYFGFKYYYLSWMPRIIWWGLYLASWIDCVLPFVWFFLNSFFLLFFSSLLFLFLLREIANQAHPFWSSIYAQLLQLTSMVWFKSSSYSVLTLHCCRGVQKWYRTAASYFCWYDDR